jgi:transposase InsO family protein
MVVDAVRDAAWTTVVDQAGVERRKMTPEGLYGRKKMTALIRRTAITGASCGAVDRAMRILGLSGITRAKAICTTVFRDGPYQTIANVEFATAGWVDWYNHRKLHGSLGMVSPDEYEAAYYAALSREPLPA